MAIKPPDLLNRLPSVSELLDKPPIRALAERWNRSVVAGGVRSFLDELRTDFERRAAAALPSIRELADRAARYVVSRQNHTLGVAINATGRICGSPWATTPLPEIALERAMAFGREFGVEKTAGAALTSDELESLLCRMTGAQAAAAVHSYSGAIWVALTALAADREVLVARAEVGDVAGDESLPKIASAANVLLKEVGGTNRSAAVDFDTAVSPRAAAILTLSSDNYRIVGETASAEFDELIAIARERELLLIDALGAAPLVDPPATIKWPRRSAQASLATGADLVILRGDGLVGGPTSGILLGTHDAIGRIKNHSLFSPLRIELFRAAALAATVECYDNPARGSDLLPVWQCLTTSVENLKNRAERMAAQLTHAEGIAAATAIETSSPVSPAISGDGWPSYGVALAVADGNVGALSDRMRSARFPVVGRVEGERLILDLRTVLPRQDKLIVDSFLGESK